MLFVVTIWIYYIGCHGNVVAIIFVMKEKYIAYDILYYNHTIIHKNNKMASNLDALPSCRLP